MACWHNNREQTNLNPIAGHRQWVSPSQPSTSIPQGSTIARSRSCSQKAARARQLQQIQEWADILQWPWWPQTSDKGQGQLRLIVVTLSAGTGKSKSKPGKDYPSLPRPGWKGAEILQSPGNERFFAPDAGAQEKHSSPAPAQLCLQWYPARGVKDARVPSWLPPPRLLPCCCGPRVFQAQTLSASASTTTNTQRLPNPFTTPLRKEGVLSGFISAVPQAGTSILAC